MPTYPYKCNACGHEFDQFQSIMAKPIRKCPVCGKNRVQRLIAAGAGLIFKGSGFYTTDYRSDAYQTSAKADTAAPAAAPSGSTDAKSSDGKAGGDAKPAAETKASGETKSTETKSTEAKPAATEKSAGSSRRSKRTGPSTGRGRIPERG